VLLCPGTSLYVAMDKSSTLVYLQITMSGPIVLFNIVILLTQGTNQYNQLKK